MGWHRWKETVLNVIWVLLHEKGIKLDVNYPMKYFNFLMSLGCVHPSLWPLHAKKGIWMNRSTTDRESLDRVSWTSTILPKLVFFGDIKLVCTRIVWLLYMVSVSFISISTVYLFAGHAEGDPSKPVCSFLM